jgi:hypothetical protein
LRWRGIAGLPTLIEFNGADPAMAKVTRTFVTYDDPNEPPRPRQRNLGDILGFPCDPILRRRAAKAYEQMVRTGYGEWTDYSGQTWTWSDTDSPATSLIKLN